MTFGDERRGLSLSHPIHTHARTHTRTHICLSVIKGERRKKRVWRLALTCVREQGMVVGVIVEFRPHAEGEFFHVWQICLVVDVLQEGERKRNQITSRHLHVAFILRLDSTRRPEYRSLTRFTLLIDCVDSVKMHVERLSNLH